MSEREWWEPVPVDAAYIAELRENYPDKCDGMSDEWVVDHFNEAGGKYAVTWDHLGDAYAQFEELADAYYKLKSQAGKNEGASK